MTAIIDIIFEFVLSIIWELILQFILEGLFELGFRTVAAPFRLAREHPVMAGVGIVALGAASGWLTIAIAPQRVFGVTGVPGASLVLAPLWNGAFMEIYGRWREQHGKRRSYLATWWGGGLFALSMALVRFLGIEP